LEARGESAATPVAAKGDPDAAAAAAHVAPADDGGLPVLAPGSVRLHRGPTGVLRATLDDGSPRSYLQVQVYRAFPLSDPALWAVLIDGQGREIGMIEDPLTLEEESRRLCAEELQLRYLTPHVTEIVAIREDAVEGGGSWSPVLVWDLATDRGPLRMRLPNLMDHVRLLGPRRLLIWDRDGRRAEIRDVDALPETGRKWLRRYLWI